MKKWMIGGVAVAALASGSLAVAALSPVQIAGANGVDAQAAPGTTQPGQQGKGNGPRQSGFDKSLDDLVKDGSISQDQANKIKDKVKANRSAKRTPGTSAQAKLKDVAGMIGIQPKELGTELKAGKSIAEVAQAHGVDPQKIIDTIVGDATKRIDEAVAAGKIPAERAAKMKSRLADRATKFVNHKRTPHERRPRANKGQGGEQAPTTTAPAPTTTAPAPTTEAPATTAAPTTTAPAAPKSESPNTTAAPSTQGSSAPGTTGG